MSVNAHSYVVKNPVVLDAADGTLTCLRAKTLFNISLWLLTLKPHLIITYSDMWIPACFQQPGDADTSRKRFQQVVRFQHVRPRINLE